MRVEVYSVDEGTRDRKLLKTCDLSSIFVREGPSYNKIVAYLTRTGHYYHQSATKGLLYITPEKSK